MAGAFGHADALLLWPEVTIGNAAHFLALSVAQRRLEQAGTDERLRSGRLSMGSRAASRMELSGGTTLMQVQKPCARRLNGARGGGDRAAYGRVREAMPNRVSLQSAPCRIHPLPSRCRRHADEQSG